MKADNETLTDLVRELTDAPSIHAAFSDDADFPDVRARVTISPRIPKRSAMCAVPQHKGETI